MIVKINEIRLGKLNNAEYTNFIERTYKEAQIATAKKLCVTDEALANLQANIAKMHDLVSQSS